MNFKINNINQIKLRLLFTITILLFTLLISFQGLAEAPLKIDIAGFTGNNRNFIQMGTFLPITQNEEGLLFGDARILKHLPHFKKKNKSIYSEDTYEFNFGLGYRHVIHQDLVLGGVAYYDIRKAQLKNTTFHQTTLNMHILSHTWQSNLNLYIPVGKDKITKSSRLFQNEARIVNNDVFFLYKDQAITEKALKGVDFRISTVMPNIDSLRLGPVAYYFQGNKSVTGGGLEIKWTYDDSINIESSITYDKLRKANFIVGARFTFPSSTKNKARPVDKLLATRVERDIDLVTSNKTTNSSTQEKQENVIALNKTQLSSINNPNKVDENKELILKLLSVVENDGQIIITDDNNSDIIALNSTNTFESKSLSTSIETAKSAASTKLANNTKTETLVNEAITSDKKTIEKVTDIVATQQAIREKSNYNTIFVGNQSVPIKPDQKFLDDLVKKFSSAGNSKNQSYHINLPGYGNVEVKRAGTILLVKKDDKDYVVIGVDENSANRNANSNNKPYSTWFTGSLNAKDGSVYEGLMRETFEESVGTVYITKAEFEDAIKNKQFMYDPQAKTLAIVKRDNNASFDINALNTKLSQIKQDGNISGAFKEMKEYILVHPNELQRMNDAIKTNNGGNKNRRNNIYNVSTYNNQSARILKKYADSFYIGKGVDALHNTIGNFK